MVPFLVANWSSQRHSCPVGCSNDTRPVRPCRTPARQSPPQSSCIRQGEPSRCHTQLPDEQQSNLDDVEVSGCNGRHDVGYKFGQHSQTSVQTHLCLKAPSLAATPADSGGRRPHFNVHMTGNCICCSGSSDGSGQSHRFPRPQRTQGCVFLKRS